LGDFIKVRGADLRDGLLSITLEREVPEAMKPHKIRIGSPGNMIEDGRTHAPSGDNENARKEEAA
jgi:molecular chaperone IbpA